MTFAQLQYLLEIHKTGSFSQAAKNLFVSQPSLSLTLKTLEAELGYPIFLRTRKGLVPTSQGAAVIDHAARICESYRLLTAPEPRKATFVRISSASIPPIQNAFIQLIDENKDRRDISFSLTQENDCLENLRNFTLEIGFVLLTTRYLSYLDTVQKYGLQSQLVTTLPGAIRIGRGHPLFEKEDVSQTDFEDDMFLDSSNSTVSKALLDAGIARIKPNYNIISSQHTVRNDLVLKGLAYDITFCLPTDLHTQTDFRYIPLEGLSYKLLAITNPLHPPVPEVERYMALLSEELQAAGIGK